MAADLKDFRGKITAETDTALEAESRTSGRERADIAREILHAWAVRKIHDATVLASLARSQGLLGESGGLVRESQGISGRRRE